MQPPTPKTPLAIHRLLSPTSGLHASPFILGAMTIGDQWGHLGMGHTDKDTSFKLLDAFYDAGGNFVDTANHYQNESSETFLGEWMEQRGTRDQMIIATKYTAPYKGHDANIQQKICYQGNSNKSLQISVEASLNKLRTTYIDILYVHLWDYTTSIKTVMDSLHTLVQARKVLYLGVSDTPAWVVSQANEYANRMGKTPFIIYQGAWNIMSRDFEREILPMARSHNMALAPFNVLAGGHLRSSAEERRRTETGEGGRTVFGKDWKKSEQEIKMTQALEKVAKEVGKGEEVDTAAIAIAYLLHKAPYVFPLVGMRKVEQLQSNIKALEISLSKEQVNYLESIVPFDPGFPAYYAGDSIKYTDFWKGSVCVAPKPIIGIVPPNTRD